MADAVPATPAKKGRKPKGGAKKPKSDRPSTMELVIEAMEVEKDPKGTSVLAIKKYIMANHQVRSAQFLNHMLRRAFEAGLADGKLSRPNGQAEYRPLMGRYRLATKEKTQKATSELKPKARSPAKKVAAKVKTPKKPAAATKKAKSPKKVKKTPKKPAAKKTTKKV